MQISNLVVVTGENNARQTVQQTAKRSTTQETTSPRIPVESMLSTIRDARRPRALVHPRPTTPNTAAHHAHILPHAHAHLAHSSSSALHPRRSTHPASRRDHAPHVPPGPRHPNRAYPKTHPANPAAAGHAHVRSSAHVARARHGVHPADARVAHPAHPSHPESPHAHAHAHHRVEAAHHAHHALVHHRHVAGAGVVHRHVGRAVAHRRGVTCRDLAVVETVGWRGGSMSESLLIALAAWLCRFHFNLSAGKQ
ncbi:hypothetical protein EDB83DRAFT_1640665 [Lactarius deliciosus]|nr:hypothetical protein EDB83DRAFT_1640665 [Lactarius deliciosus]